MFSLGMGTSLSHQAFTPQAVPVHINAIMEFHLRMGASGLYYTCVLDPELYIIKEYKLRAIGCYALPQRLSGYSLREDEQDCTY